jgi:hypothetical protein
MKVGPMFMLKLMKRTMPEDTTGIILIIKPNSTV